MIQPGKKLLRHWRIAAIAALAAAAATIGIGALQAQQSAPSDVSDPLNLPADIKMLGKDDPNVRKPTAVVNGYIITGTDVDQRVALVLDANSAKVADDELQRLRAQVLRNMIDETLQIQEAKAQDVEVSQSDIDASYNRVATQNFGQDPAALDAYLYKIGSSPASLKRQIQGELSWQALMRRNIVPFINVSEEEVNEVLERMKASKGTDEYHLAEIYLSATPETQQAVYQNAQRIIDQIKQGANFQAYARQFSEASTAVVGGDLGWVRLPLLPTELANVAKTMQPGQLVGPVQIPGGFSILYLIDRRKVLTADPRDAVLSLKQISITFPPGMSATDAQQKVDDFTSRVKMIRGCGDADAAAAAMGAEVVGNDQVPVRNLPPALQDSLLQLAVGQATPPFGSMQDGVRVLLLCGRDDPKAADAPSFDKVMDQLQNDRVNKRAQRYLRDLRRDAIIEYN